VQCVCECVWALPRRTLCQAVAAAQVHEVEDVLLEARAAEPTEALRNCGPMRGSVPTARATSSTSAPLASHSAEIELIDDMRCARNALATSLESSEDHRFVVMMRSRAPSVRTLPRGSRLAWLPSSDLLPADEDARGRLQVSHCRAPRPETLGSTRSAAGQGIEGERESVIENACKREVPQPGN